jgi:hypothetical protein
MTDDPTKQPSQDEGELEREIRRERKFTLSEAIGRLAGPGAMKGISPVTRLRQADLQIEAWLESHLLDTGGLAIVLHREVKESEILLNNLDQPLIALAGYCQQVLDSEYLLKELVRSADCEWGRIMLERPHFEREGSPPHPDDPYTIASVRRTLSELLDRLAEA